MEQGNPGLQERIAQRLRRLRLFLLEPGAWSAEHYRRKNRMDFAALRPEEWKKQ